MPCACPLPFPDVSRVRLPGRLTAWGASWSHTGLRTRYGRFTSRRPRVAWPREDRVSQAAEMQRRTAASPEVGPRDAARLIGRTGAVDAVGLEARAASLA